MTETGYLHILAAGAESLDTEMEIREECAAGADVNGIGRNGGTPLMSAVRNERLSNIEILVNLGADVNKAGRFGVTPLMVAADVKSTEACALLVRMGARGDAKDARGRSALHRLLIWNDEEGREDSVSDICEILLQAGALPNEQDDDGVTPMSLALSNKSVTREILQAWQEREDFKSSGVLGKMKTSRRI